MCVFSVSGAVVELGYWEHARFKIAHGKKKFKSKFWRSSGEQRVVKCDLH